jgi:hypothetical protein
VNDTYIVRTQHDMKQTIDGGTYHMKNRIFAHSTLSGVAVAGAFAIFGSFASAGLCERFSATWLERIQCPTTGTVHGESQGNTFEQGTCACGIKCLFTRPVNGTPTPGNQFTRAWGYSSGGVLQSGCNANAFTNNVWVSDNTGCNGASKHFLRAGW